MAERSAVRRLAKAAVFSVVMTGLAAGGRANAESTHLHGSASYSPVGLLTDPSRALHLDSHLEQIGDVTREHFTLRGFPARADNVRVAERAQGEMNLIGHGTEAVLATPGAATPDPRHSTTLREGFPHNRMIVPEGSFAVVAAAQVRGKIDRFEFDLRPEEKAMNIIVIKGNPVTYTRDGNPATTVSNTLRFPASIVVEGGPRSRTFEATSLSEEAEGQVISGNDHDFLSEELFDATAQGYLDKGLKVRALMFDLNSGAFTIVERGSVDSDWELAVKNHGSLELPLSANCLPVTTLVDGQDCVLPRDIPTRR